MGGCIGWRAILSNMISACTEDWDRFRYSVKNRHRYVLGPSLLGGEDHDGLISNEHFLEWLLYFLKERNRFVKLDKGTVLWRAQLDGTPYRPSPITLFGEEHESSLILAPHGRVRMTPHSDKAKEGRINPKGIPCLYTATHPRVALAEIKPTINSYLTLAEFVTVRELRIVDFASEPIEIANFDEGPNDDEMDSLTWEYINESFAEPVTSTDDVAAYAPTQILGELFKCAGYDGIRYKSKCSQFESLQPRGSQEHIDETRSAKAGGGLNVALFKIADAEFTTSRLYRFAVNTDGQFDFREVKMEVFCSERIPDLRP
jgi:hypothetical protein